LPPGYPQAYRPKTPGYAIALFIISIVLLVWALAFGLWRLFLDKPMVTAYESFAEYPSATPPALQTPEPQNELPVFPSPETSAPGVNLMALFYKTAPAFQNGNIIIRWDSEIKVQIEGGYTQEEYDLLSGEIGRVNGLGLLPQITLVESGGNFVYWFVPQDEMASYIDTYVEGNESYYSYKGDDHRLSSFTAVISTDARMQYRSQIEVYFLMKGLGFLGDTIGIEDTDTALGLAGYLTENDLALLSMLYSPLVTPGMTADEAYDALASGQQTNEY
jgi:hypothetical protein